MATLLCTNNSLEKMIEPVATHTPSSSPPSYILFHSNPRCFHVCFPQPQRRARLCVGGKATVILGRTYG